MPDSSLVWLYHTIVASVCDGHARREREGRGCEKYGSLLTRGFRHSQLQLQLSLYPEPRERSASRLNDEYLRLRRGTPTTNPPDHTTTSSQSMRSKRVDASTTGKVKYTWTQSGSCGDSKQPYWQNDVRSARFQRSLSEGIL